MEVILIGIILFFLWLYLYYRSEIKESRRIALEEEQKQKEENEALEKKYGKRSRKYDEIGISLSVYKDSRTILINGEEFSFDEISGCTVREVKKIIPGSSTSTFVTKTSGKSMAGRALVGAVIAGPVGAIIGGTTAKKETVGETITSPDSIEYRYYLTINVNKEGSHGIFRDTKLKSAVYNIKSIIDEIKDDAQK